ncbi:glycosyltransferase family 87 protein [Micromonospora sp. NPDC007220]|uniref:glycosyltransferase family 87 protein n=1 Tax=Micromonospora sp. NPDC007220 TaxID=3154318 RepID=UPI0033F18309
MVDPSLNSVSEPVAAEPTRRPRRRPSRADVLAIGAYVLLGVFVCLNYWVDVQNRVSSHLPTDHSWFEWLFSHGAYSVRHLENPLFTERQNAPDGVNMMANTSLLGVTLPLAPLTMLLGPQVMYALYLGGALAATAGTSYWMLSRHLVRSRAAAFVGGAFLGFAPGIVHHANGQPNFVSNFLLPLIVVRVLRLGEPGRWRRNGIVLGLLVAYQIFINEEMLLLTALACLVVVVAYAIMRPARTRAVAGTFAAALGVGGALALLLTAYPIWFQFNGPQSYRGLQGGVFHNWGEDLAAFVTFARDTVAGDEAVEKTIGLTEQNTWFGWPLVLLSLVALVLLVRRSLAARILAVLVVVFTVASIGPKVRINGVETETDGPWAYVSDDLPLVEMMMPTRLALVVAAALGVLLALAWDTVAGSGRPPVPAPRAGSDGDDRAAGADAAGSRRRWLRPVGYAAVALAVLPLFPRPLPAEPVDPPPHFITAGGWRPYVPEGRTLVPVPIPSNVHGLPTLRWSALTQHAFPIPGGYFIGPNELGEGVFGAPNRPTSTLIYSTMDKNAVPSLTDENRRQAVEDLRFWRASVVVLGAHPREAVLRELMTALIGPSQRVDDVWLWDVRPLVG